MKVEVYASDMLNVTVSGPTQVIYDGDPAVNQKVSGHGSVVRRDPGGA
jgi:hypothetical protein